MTAFLSPNFSLEELTCSQTASRRGLDNTPPPEVLEHLKGTALRMEAVRDVLGDGPIVVSSGYRSPAVNAAVGGVANSAHCQGWAVDFICPAFGDPFAICKAVAASLIEFDQVIQEGTWVHISFAPSMRRQCLAKVGDGYQPGIAA